MKQLVLLLAASLILPAAPSRARAGEISVVVSGKPQDAAETYVAGGKLYLDAKRVGALYGGQVYWYPVSGRVQLSLRGRSLQIVAGSNKASAGDRDMKMSDAVIVRVSHAFVPVSFLSGPEFSSWSGHQTRYDERTKSLVVEKTGTVGAPAAFSYKGHTRISLALAPGASYHTSARGTGGVDLVVDYGVAEGNESVSLDDGVVDSYALKQEAKLVRLSVRFAEAGQRWRAAELSDPRRAVLDIYAPGEALPAETSVSKKEDVKETTKEAAKAAAAAPAPAPVPAPAPASASKPSAKAAPEPAHKRRLIVIDPGHGGKDPGATGVHGTREKDVNLAEALELSRVLKERGDFDVLLTRDEDVFIPLSDRSELANSRDADLFVSLHCNAAGNKRESR
ncbi:MAG: N-acetylmuramoyl-L-alanine amidase, partial [Elusimicrobia bacterium]|nr:N-acetylmuramoyl-L-alanine amidase [Elusimicrobiota bacterium]